MTKAGYALEKPDISFADLQNQVHELTAELQKAEATIRSYQSGAFARQQQDRELRDIYLLQEVSGQLIHAQDAQALYQTILDAAVMLMQADKGSIQLYDSKTEQLVLIATHNVDSALHEASQLVDVNSGASCAIALQTRERACIPDFSKDAYATSPAGVAHRAAGILAAQTTPLITRSGVLLGMMSTHWSRPFEADAHSLRMMDILARQAADLIERNRAEESLRASESRLETELADTKLLQGLSAQMIHEDNLDNLYAMISDAIRTIMHSDCASIQMFYPERGTAGMLRLLASSGLDQASKDFWEWVRPQSGTTCAAALRTGKRFMTSDMENCEHIINTPDHAKFMAAGIRAAQSTPLFSRNGQLIGMVSTHWRGHHLPSERDLRLLDILARQAADLIERKKAEDALQQSQLALFEADRRKDEFLATLAHELRNPLAPIRNGIHLIRMRPDNSKINELSDMMDRQVTHLVRLIDDLLDISRVSQGKIDLRRESITLQTVVQAALEASQPLIDSSKHKLTLNLPDYSLWLDADLTRIAQVVSNLINNAAKYTPDAGQITISASQEGGDAVLSVTDNGIGIPEDMLPKVFDMFAQVDSNLDRAQGGLGIGLALVKRLLQMHGGEIRASSPGPGQGSTFTFRLPLAKVTSNSGTHEQAPTAIYATKEALRILVVDDNVPSAQTTSWLLEEMGHKLEVAHSGVQALGAVKTFSPDLFLLDIGLPDMNGYELCRELRKDPRFKDTLFIAQTGWGQERDRQLSKEAGFDHHFVKPIDVGQLLLLLAARE